jgi:hypothetical protein
MQQTNVRMTARKQKDLLLRKQREVASPNDGDGKNFIFYYFSRENLSIHVEYITKVLYMNFILLLSIIIHRPIFERHGIWQIYPYKCTSLKNSYI